MQKVEVTTLVENTLFGTRDCVDETVLPIQKAAKGMTSIASGPER